MRTKKTIEPNQTFIAPKNISERHTLILSGKSEDPESDLDYIYKKVGEFLNNNCNFEVIVPGNEKNPWKEQDLNMKVNRMPVKRESKEAQIADYQVKITDGDITHRLGICFERKSLDDAIGTFMTGSRRKRFYREYRRFIENENLKQFRVIIEGTYHDFLYYQNTVSRICKTCDYCDKTWKGREINYWCKRQKYPEPTDGDMKCDWHIPKVKTEEDIENDVHRRRATIEGLEARGIRVSFYSSREEAAGSIKDACRQYAIKNYCDIFGLEKYGLLKGEDQDTLTFEVSGMKFKVPKDAVEVLA